MSQFKHTLAFTARCNQCSQNFNENLVEAEMSGRICPKTNCSGYLCSGCALLTGDRCFCGNKTLRITSNTYMDPTTEEHFALFFLHKAKSNSRLYFKRRSQKRLFKAWRENKPAGYKLFS